MPTRITAQDMARKFRIRDAARQERLADEARQRHREEQRDLDDARHDYGR